MFLPACLVDLMKLELELEPAAVCHTKLVGILVRSRGIDVKIEMICRMFQKLEPAIVSLSQSSKEKLSKSDELE